MQRRTEHVLHHKKKLMESTIYHAESSPDSLFQVLNVVNTNTVGDLLHIPLEIKIRGGFSSGERWGRETLTWLLGQTQYITNKLTN
jgi:hypothetical protein